MQINKNTECVRDYLNMLQNNINRMHESNKSFRNILIPALISIVLAINNISWLFIVLILVFAYLYETYFLYVEKKYISKYNEMIKKLNTNKATYEDIYDMSPCIKCSKKEKSIMIILSLLSIPRLLLYLELIITLIIIKIQGGI